MLLPLRTRTAACCAAVSAALVAGMAGATVAFSDSTCGWMDCDGLALHSSTLVPTTPRTASTPEPPATPVTTAGTVGTARTPTP